MEWGTAFGIFSLPNDDFLNISKDVALLWFALVEVLGNKLSVFGGLCKGIQVNTYVGMLFLIEKLIYFDAIITLTHRKRSPLSQRERTL